MNRASGYLCVTDPDLGRREWDTFTCRHCQRIRAVGSGGYCRQCDSMICECCVGKACRPFLKLVEQAEEREYRRSQACG